MYVYSLNKRTIWHIGDATSVRNKEGKVLYWMQQSQRVRLNHALILAHKLAKENGRELEVLFVVVPDYPDAQLSHYTFMLEGLAETALTLRQMGINFRLVPESLPEGVFHHLEDVAAVVMDMGVMPIQKRWRQEVIGWCREHENLPVAEVATDMTVPPHLLSDKVEYGAYTIRPKFWRLFPEYYELSMLEAVMMEVPVMAAQELEEGLEAVFTEWLEIGRVEHAPLLVDAITQIGENTPEQTLGGERMAFSRLNEFLENGLENYQDRRDPLKAEQHQSHLSPYLHFGQISPLTVVQGVYEKWRKDGDALKPSIEDFLEELLVRRELAINYVFHSPHDCSKLEDMLPDWALKTLFSHGSDDRSIVYDYKTLEHGSTQDSLWNAMQKQLVKTGFLPGYVRMYWGKRVMEWTRSPQEAYEWLLRLNDTYALDGRDANSIVGIAWCFGLHDRAFKERAVYGKVRYLSMKALQGKINVDAYLQYVKKL